MREIKFRAWDNFNECFYYATMDDLLNGNRPLDIRVATQWDQLGCVDQFTGLRDKNGRDIYEGDILKHYACGIDYIIYSENCAGFIFANGNTPFSCNWAGECEVIGNIHNNPDLLS